MSLEEANKIIAEDRINRQKECVKIIEETLRSLNCKIEIVLTLQDDVIQKVPKIIAL